MDLGYKRIKYSNFLINDLFNFEILKTLKERKLEILWKFVKFQKVASTVRVTLTKIGDFEAVTALLITPSDILGSWYLIQSISVVLGTLLSLFRDFKAPRPHFMPFLSLLCPVTFLLLPTKPRLKGGQYIKEGLLWLS